MTGTEQALDFECVQNTNFRMYFTAYNPDGSLMDLTSATIKQTIMKKKGDTPLVTKSTALSGGYVVIKNQTSSKGQFYIDLIPSDITTLQGSYVHDEVVTDSDGKVSNLRNIDGTYGKITFTPQFATP